MRRILLAVAVGGLLAVAPGSATLSAPPGGDGQLAFHSELNGKDSEIFLVDLAKLGSPVNVTNNPAKDVSPAWNPSGKQLAFASDRSGTSRIYVLNPVTKGVTVLTPGGPAGQLNPAWCTDTKIAFAANGDLFIADRTSGQATNLTNSPGSTESQPACTPDGTKVLFASGTATTRNLFDTSHLTPAQPRQISPSGWLTVDPAVNALGTELLFFGRSPDGRQGLWKNTYSLKATASWNPKLVLEAKPPRELRLTKYDPQLPFAWTPSFKQGFLSRFFGTDLPQGPAASTGTRSLFFFDSKSVRTLGYPNRFGEDANPAPRPLPTVYSRKGFFGLGGTNGTDSVSVTFGKEKLRVTAGTGLFTRLFDNDRTVIRGGYSIAYDPPFQNVILDLAGGDDVTRITGTPPKTLHRVTVNCGSGLDLVILIDVDFGPTKFGSCEQVKRR